MIIPGRQLNKFMSSIPDIILNTFSHLEYHVITIVIIIIICIVIIMYPDI